MVAVLTEKLEFPPVTSAGRDGLLAIGGDLSIPRLLTAYRSGIFPWPMFEDGIMTWFSPDPRAVLELEPDRFHVSRSLDRCLRRPVFEVTFDRDFEGVIRECAAPAEGRMSTWITLELMRAYVALHYAGHAHSVECWREDELVGGAYGVSIGGLFAGESMFSRVSNASKVALYHLTRRLRARGYVLFDTQIATKHLRTLGVIEVSRREYLRRLADALERQCRFD